MELFIVIHPQRRFTHIDRDRSTQLAIHKPHPHLVGLFGCVGYHSYYAVLVLIFHLLALGLLLLANGCSTHSADTVGDATTA